MRLVDGEIQIIPYGNAMKNDCNMGASSTEWKAIMPDGSLVNPGTTGTLKYDVISGAIKVNTSITSQSNPNIAFKDLKANSGIEIPKILIAAGLFPEASATYGGDRLYVNNEGERLPFRGSSYYSTSNAGASALNLSNPRSHVSSLVGFRSAFVE